MMDHECFKMLNEKLEVKTNDTIYRPISFSQTTGQLSADEWGIRVEYTETKGKRTLKKHITLFISYCPICGKALNGEEPPAPKDGE